MQIFNGIHVEKQYLPLVLFILKTIKLQTAKAYAKITPV